MKNLESPLDKLIAACEWSISYHEEKIQEERLKLDAYYRARDAEADKPATYDYIPE